MTMLSENTTMAEKSLQALFSLAAAPPPLRIVEGGALRVGKSRITLDLIVEEYDSGMTPEDMVRAYDTHLSHRDAVRAYMKRREVEAAALRCEIEARQPSVSREELLARRAAKEKADAGH